MLRILLLGAPAVLLDDRPIRIQRRFQRALLFYLACQPDAVSRSNLMLLFWPEAADQDARRRLRETLSKLRGQLNDDSLWIADNDRVGLNFKNVYVDAREFLDLVTQNWRSIRQIPNETPLPEAVYQQMMKANALWRGQRFLAGASLPSSPEFDRWLLETSQTTELSRQSMLERMGHHKAATGDLESGIYWLRQALQYDLVNDTLHMEVLHLIRRVGRRNEMLNYCDYVQNLYLQEAGGDPPRQLADLCEKIRAESTAPGHLIRINWPASLSMQVPFVGREQAQKDLKLLYNQGGSAAILGEAGAGKTRLVQQFYLSLDPAPRLLLAQARSSESGLPFQPLIEMLRKHIREEEWRRLDPVWLAPLTQLLPELFSLRPELPAPRSDLNEARASLFEALRQLFLLLASSQRLLFFFDDVHWSDEASLSALSYLQERQFFTNYGLLVLAARPEEVNIHLEHFLNRPHAHSMMKPIKLHQLTPEEVGELTRYALGQNPSETLIQNLTRDTGGNPLFLIETLRAWLEVSPNPDAAQPVEQIPLSSSIRNLLRERLLTVTMRSRMVLSAAAVIGHDFSPELLEEVTDFSPGLIVQSLEELERAHLIQPDGRTSQAGGYSFIHDIFREVLLQELSPARRRLLHLRVAQTLEGIYKGQIAQQAALLAAHYESSGKTEQAFNYWLRAAVYARSMLSRAEAYAAFSRAEQIFLQASQRLGERDIYNLYSAWGEMAFDLNDADTLQRVYASLKRMGEQRRSPLLFGSGLSGLSSACSTLNQPDEAMGYLKDAIPYLEQSGDVYEQVEAYNRLGSVYIAFNNFNGAGGAYQKAAELGKNSTDMRVRAALVNAEDWAAMIFNMFGQPIRALELAEHTMHERLLLSPSTGQVRTLVVLAQSFYYLGQYQRASEICRSGIEVADGLGAWRWGSMLHSILGSVELALGHFDESWEQQQITMEIGEHYRFWTVVSDALFTRGTLLQALGDFNGAAASYQKGVTATQNTYLAMQNMTGLGWALMATGQMQHGRTLIQQALAFTEPAGLDALVFPARLVMASENPDQLPAGEVEKMLLELTQETGQRNLAWISCMAEAALGKLRLKSNRPAEAWDNAQQIIRRGREMNSPILEILGNLLAYQALRAQGGQPVAIKERVLDLLKIIEKHTRQPALSAPMKQYHHRILEQLN